MGIDNLWHDVNAAGQEEPAGSNPMWHAKNLQGGRAGSYLAAYGLDPTAALVRNAELRGAVLIWHGRVTHAGIAAEAGLPCSALTDADLAEAA